MKTSIVLIICLVGACRAVPKVDISSWDNLLQIGGDVEVTKSSSGRSNDVSIQGFMENYLKSNELSFKLPIVGSKMTMTARNLDNNELGFKLNFNSGSQVEARGKKSKLKKIFAPILVFILIKAMTLIPLALGILSLKTWNAIQLSFVSFVTTLAMAVWKLCSKVNGDHQPPPHIIHEAFDPHHHHHIAAARSDQVDANDLAYNGYAPQPQI